MARRFRPLRTWRFWVGWLIALAVVARFVYLTRFDNTPKPLEEGNVRVQFVIDGDTLILEDRAKVRLIGVDTPETHDRSLPTQRWGPEATAFARAFVEAAGGKVRLQLDNERFDRYGRHLAYVWHGEKMLNEELIRTGLGRFTPGYRFSSSMKRRFAKAELEAKASRAGMWADP